MRSVSALGLIIYERRFLSGPCVNSWTISAKTDLGCQVKQMFNQQKKGLCAKYTFYLVLCQAWYTRPWELAFVQHLPPNLSWPSQSTASELGLLLVYPINELRHFQLFPSPSFLLALPNETGTAA